jgi:hypothetical protein
MFHGLQQRIRLPAGWRRLCATKPGTKTIQLLLQLAPQPTDRFQGKG